MAAHIPFTLSSLTYIYIYITKRDSTLTNYRALTSYETFIIAFKGMVGVVTIPYWPMFIVLIGALIE
jgi:hypothetical protein